MPVARGGGDAVIWQQLLANGLIAGSTYGLVALGFTLIYSVGRFFHFAHAGVICFSGYATLTLMTRAHFSFGVAIAVSIILSALMGVLMEAGVYRPLRKARASSVSLLVASLGLYVVIQNVISMAYGDEVQTLFNPARAGFLLSEARITPVQLVILSVNAVLYVLVVIFLARTRSGRMVRALASDPELACIFGIDQSRVTLLVFAVGSGLAAVAGILISCDTTLTPTMGFRALLMGVVAAIVGGVGSVPGAIIGGMFIGLVQHFGISVLPTQWQDAIVFAILILFLLVRPQGVLGTPLKKAEV
jgi:branched-chain amino acid transport system permease protein